MSSAYRKIQVPWESWFRKRVDVYNEEERANNRTLGDTRLNWKRRGRVTVKDNSLTAVGEVALEPLEKRARHTNRGQ